MMRNTFIQRPGNTLEFEGCIVEFDRTAEIRAGDTYLAERNTGPQLLTCDHVSMGAVFPVGPAYPYDLDECAKVVAIDGEPVEGL